MPAAPGAATREDDHGTEVQRKQRDEDMNTTAAHITTGRTPVAIIGVTTPELLATIQDI
jgi:hypothetical protein